MPAWGRRFAIAAVTGGALAMLISGGLGGERGRAHGIPRAQIAGLIPRFDPLERYYAARCGPEDSPIVVRAARPLAVRVGSRPPRSGRRIRLHAPASPGDDFRLTLTRGGAKRSYHVRCLPAGFPQWSFERLRPVGHDLFAVSIKESLKAPQWVVVFDTRGAPRWWYRPGERVLWAQVLRDGTVSWPRAFGDGYGQRRGMAHEIHSTTGELLRVVRTQGSIIDGHELRETRGGRILVASYVPHPTNLQRVGGPREGAIVAAEVQELDRRGKVVWRWSSRGKVRLGETRLRWWARILANPRTRLGGLPTFDPVHINAIEPRGRDEVVISSRHTDAIYGIRRSTGTIAWKLGGRGRAGGLRVVGDPAERRFGGQHDVRVADDGTLSVFDNAKLRAYRPRVAFYRLRLGRNEARFVGQLRDPLVRSSHCCGSARQLRDGGWLVSWGHNRLVTGFDRDRRIAFRLRLPAATYRAVPVPPRAVTLAQLDRSLERILRRERAASPHRLR